MKTWHNHGLGRCMHQRGDAVVQSEKTLSKVVPLVSSRGIYGKNNANEASVKIFRQYSLFYCRKTALSRYYQPVSLVQSLILLKTGVLLFSERRAKEKQRAANKTYRLLAARRIMIFKAKLPHPLSRTVPQNKCLYQKQWSKLAFFFWSVILRKSVVFSVTRRPTMVLPEGQKIFKA